MTSENSYTLRQVADLTGLSEFTLRGWEGRYEAFKPDRTETGRRQYTKHDLKRAFLLRELTSLGYRIGDIAQLSNSALEKKLDKESPDSTHEHSPQNEKAEAILKLALLQDWEQLKKVVNELLHRQDPLSAIDKVILPILSYLGSYITNQRIGVAQEHIVSSVLKEQLYTLLYKASIKSKNKNKLSVVITTPEGDYHELGILIAHVVFTALGVRSLYLGPNTPKNELCETAIRFGASHILLSSTVNRKGGAHEEIFSYVHYLDYHLPDHVELWIGGRNFEKVNFNLQRNVKLFKTIQELPISIKNLLSE